MYLSIYLPIFSPIYDETFTVTGLHNFICSDKHLSTCLSIYLSIYLATYLSIFPFIGHTCPREWTSSLGLLDVGILVSWWGMGHQCGIQYRHVEWDVFVHPLVNVAPPLPWAYSTLRVAHYHLYKVDVGGGEDLYGGGYHRPPIGHGVKQSLFIF